MIKEARFIRPQHPKSNIKPDIDTIAKFLELGWIGQRKVNGHRVQAHISPNGEIVPFTRNGQIHTKSLSAEITEAILRTFKSEDGWTVIDAEWQKQENKLYLFDLLALNGTLLRDKNYSERFTQLRQFFRLDPNIEFLPLLKTVVACAEVLKDPSPFTEGLVFKSLGTKGFSDTSIIRCRKNGVFFVPERLS